MEECLSKKERWRKNEEMEEMAFSSSFNAMEECLTKKEETGEISFFSSFIAMEECLTKKEETEEICFPSSSIATEKEELIRLIVSPGVALR